VRLVPASNLDDAALAAVFTAGYEGYFVPIQVDERSLRFMVDAFDVDLARSRVALGEGGDPVGVALLAVRGERGWIGGMGVAPAARRRGVGKALLEAVLAEAPAEVTLEVIEQNEPAIQLYEQLGFRDTRLLEVWSLTAATRPSAAEGVTVDEAVATIRALRTAREPWQRADETVAHMRAAQEPEAAAVAGGAVLFRVTGDRVSVLQLAARDEEAASELLAAARARGTSLHFVNVPAGDPASGALRALGGTLDLRQRELVR
jgi:ribosomal protein S18 acetylase RimI-like enzyme